MTGRMRAVAVAAASATALCCQALADDYQEWIYVDDPVVETVEEVDPCGEYGDPEDARAAALASQQASDSESPAYEADDEICLKYGLTGWTTYHREMGTAMFKTLVVDYGLSGACAAGLVSNSHTESGFQYNEAEYSNRGGRYEFLDDDDWTIPPNIAWYGAVWPDYNTDHRLGVATTPVWSFKSLGLKGPNVDAAGEYPNADGYVGDWMVGAGGMFQDTPYTEYVRFAYEYLSTHPDHVSPVDGERHVWDPSLEIYKQLAPGFRASVDYTPYLFPYSIGYAEYPPADWDHMAWFTCSDEYAYQAAVAWQTCLLRGAADDVAKTAGSRYGDAEKFLKMMEGEFGVSEFKADEKKIATWFNASASSQGQSETAATTLTSATDEDDCYNEAEGNVTTGAWIDQAIMYSRDSSYGYSQDRSYSYGTGKNLDCSSLVYWSLVKCGLSSLNESTLGDSLSFYTGSMDSALTKAGFVRHAFTGSYDNVPAGSIMLIHNGSHQHTEIYIGKIDPATGKSSDSGVPYTIGAHSSYEKVGDAEYGVYGAEGDQRQIARGATGALAWVDSSGSDEVSAVPAGTGWEAYYTPDNVPGATNIGIGSDVQGSGAVGSVSSLIGDTKNLTSRQKDVINSTYTTATAGYGRCAAWVTNVFSNAGLSAPYGHARDMYFWCTSNDYSKLKPGMILVSQGGAPGGSCDSSGVPYGHVGIYIGNSIVRHNIGDIAEWDVARWVSYYTHDGYYVKWGWAAGVNLAA